MRYQDCVAPSLRQLTSWNGGSSSGANSSTNDAWKWSGSAWNHSGWNHNDWSHGGWGQWQEKQEWHVVGESDTSMVDVNEEYQQEVEQVSLEKDMFWTPEEESRKRNALLTPFEAHQLLQHSWQRPNDKADAQKVVMNFGLQKGAGRACKGLLSVMSKEAGLKKGSVCDVRSPCFSLCKHLLVSGWKAMGPPKPSLISEGYVVVTCHCLPATTFMPEGCPHVHQPLYRVDHPYKSMCAGCTKCLRCNGHLGLKQVYHFIV